MGSISTLSFTGISKYSQDFQTILSRSASIANLPVKALQNEQQNVIQKKVLATNLQSGVQSLANALSALSNVGDHQAVSASSSDTSKVAIVSTTATAPGTYTISEITSLAGAASETSTTGYADSATDSVSLNGDMEIRVGDRTVKFTLDTGKNNLVGLRDKINSLGLGVTAAILTTGTGAKPNYLSVSADTTGSNTLTLTDDPDGTPAAWLTADNQGSNAKFKLNGVPVSKSSNLINDVAPGLTFQITGTTSDNATVSLTMASDRSQLKSALQSFVSVYNSVTTEVDAQIGAAAGVLTGDPIVRQVQGILRKLSDFEGSGSIANFAGLGLEMDTSGKLSLNSETFDGLGYSQLAAAYQLVGSGREGFGSLQGEVGQLSDSVSGLLQIQIEDYNKSDQRLTDTISDLTTRNQITQLALQTKLQQADSLLAQLDSQQNVLTASLQSLTYALYGKVSGSSS